VTSESGPRQEPANANVTTESVAPADVRIVDPWAEDERRAREQPADERLIYPPLRERWYCDRCCGTHLIGDCPMADGS
jgi:hypothetical protein